MPSRREEAARVIVRYGPDLTEFLNRLGHDETVPGYRRVPLRLAGRYRELTVDRLPDSVPFVAGMDEAVTRALVLRLLLRGTTEEALRHAWPGPEAPLNILVGAVNLAGSAPRPRLPFFR